MNNQYVLENELDIDLSILEGYVEDDFYVDDEIDIGAPPEGNYGVASIAEWERWYYSESNDISSDKSLRKLTEVELDSILPLVDYGMTELTGLYDGELLTTSQVNIESLSELQKGFAHVTKNDFLFLNTVFLHEKRIIKLIPTRANPDKEKHIPEYITVKWAKLSRKYLDDATV